MFSYRKNISYLVSIEAKSHKTLRNLKPYFSSLKAIKYSRATVFVIMTLSSIFIFTKIPPQYLDPFWVFFILSIYTSGIWFIYQRFKTMNFSWIKTIPVIEQLEQYPANEKWLAIGNDSVKDEYVYQNLLVQCRKFGIGVIVMDQNNRFIIKHGLRYKSPTKEKDFLSSYIDRKEILAFTGNRPSIGLTKAHFKSIIKNNLRYICIGGSIVLTGVYATNNYSPSPYKEYHSNNVKIVKDKNREFSELPECPFFGINEYLYLIIDDVFETYHEAIQRCKELREIGFEQANCFQIDCVSSNLPKNEGYCVYPIPPSIELSTVENHLSPYREKLPSTDLKNRFGRIVSISKTVN